MGDDWYKLERCGSSGSLEHVQRKAKRRRARTFLTCNVPCWYRRAPFQISPRRRHCSHGLLRTGRVYPVCASGSLPATAHIHGKHCTGSVPVSISMSLFIEQCVLARQSASHCVHQAVCSWELTAALLIALDGTWKLVYQFSDEMERNQTECTKGPGLAA